jgi:CRISPR type III-A-associated RAMP protein Csm4
MAGPGFIVRFRPIGPWRFGPESGARDQVEKILHSDALYAALCSAMQRLGRLEEWLAGSVHSEDSRVRFSSCFPYTGEHLLITPPRHLWPPPVASNTRWKGARYIPLTAAASLVAETPLVDDAWVVDSLSECLLPAGKTPVSPPFRTAVRFGAAVDRLSRCNIDRHATACLEFAPGAGVWCGVIFTDKEAYRTWGDPLRACFRLLADTGLGGERSRGWGRSEQPVFDEFDLLDGLFPADMPEGMESAYWMLSVFSPGAADAIDWTRGSYDVVTRSGRAEGAKWGELKRTTRLVSEGSVLLATHPPSGTARDVAPADYPHPVYRAGFAFSLPVPWRVPL